MRSLRDLIGAGPSSASDVVCVDGPRELNWQDLADRRASIARALQSAAAAQPILATADPFDFLATLLASWLCDRTPIVPPNFQTATLENLARPDRLLADDRWLNAVAAGQPERMEESADGACRLIMYTSGSSGEPKAIMKSLQQFDSEIHVLEACWGDVVRDATVLATVPHHHLYGLLFRLLWPLVAGRPFLRETCLDADQLLAAARRRPRHLLVSSPSHLARLPELLTFSHWSPAPLALFSSGAPLDAGTASVYRTQFGAAPIEVLGSTEAGGIASRQRSGDENQETWDPLPQVRVERATDGALLVSSPWSDGACRLEDAVVLRADGRFELGERMDRIVKLEGKRVSLPELEMLLVAHPWVGAAAIEPVPTMNRLGAVLVLTPEGTAALGSGGRTRIARGLREYIAARTERIAVPRRYRIVKQLPVSERGKIDRMALLCLLRNDDEPLA